MQTSQAPDLLRVAAGSNSDLLRDAVLIRSWRENARAMISCYQHGAAQAKTPVAKAMFRQAAAKQESILAGLEDALRVIRKRMGEIRFDPERAA